MIRKILIISVLFLIAGCASLPDSLQSFGRVALDRAQTISSALALRDGYIELEKQIIINADRFTASELAILDVERGKVENFYLKFLDISRGGSATEILVNSEEFLSAILLVRGSIDSAINIIQPKIGTLNPDGINAAGNFVSNYRHFSMKLDMLLAKNNRKEAVLMASKFLSAAVPVIAGFL